MVKFIKQSIDGIKINLLGIEKHYPKRNEEQQ